MKMLNFTDNCKASLKRKILFVFNFKKYPKSSKNIIIFIAVFYIGFSYIYIKKFNLSLTEKIIVTDEYINFNNIKHNTINQSLVEILKEIGIIKHIFSDNINENKRLKNIIHITVSINKKKFYKYILYVSMFSLLSNCNKDKTFIIYHILCTPDFDLSSIRIFSTLVKKFSQNVEMIFYNMGNNFIKYKKSFYSQSTYYRLLVSIFIDTDRIIHLDGDTLVFSDLNEMYNLDFKDNYILGFYDVISYALDYLGLKSNIYINAGVILMNLKKLREDQKIFEIINITNSKIELRNNDQTIINYLFYPKIGRLPSKYAIFNFEDESDINHYLSLIRTKIPKKELEDALKNPIIIHSVLCSPKIWNINSYYSKEYTKCVQRNNCSCIKYIKLWHSIARKTDYYDKICKFTSKI